MRAMLANAKAVGPDRLPVELLKLVLQQDRRPSYWSSTNLPPFSGAREKSHGKGKTLSSPYATRRAIRRSEESTGASRSYHTGSKVILDG